MYACTFDYVHAVYFSLHIAVVPPGIHLSDHEASISVTKWNTRNEYSVSITAPLYNVSGNSTTASGIVKLLSITHCIYFYIFSVMFWGISKTLRCLLR